MRRYALTVIVAAVLFAARVPAGENGAVNNWVKRPTSGWKGKTNYGKQLWFAAAGARGRGILVLSLESKAGNADVWQLDSGSGAWKKIASAKIPDRYLDRKFKKYLVTEMLHGMQLCHDPDRDVLVGITTTCLDGRGRTIEFDLKAKKCSGFGPDPSPPIVTAASLCYDPVNKEVVLATGGFSPEGGTDGTWLYNGAKKQWRRLEGPKEVEAVRVPAEKARDGLRKLRWLVWKNLEFRATDREKLLDERSRAEALGKSSKKLTEELKNLSELAAKNAGTAKHAYHRKCLTGAANLMAAAAGDLAGLDEAIKSASPEAMEKLYRGKVLTALGKAEHVADKLATTPEPRMSARLVYDSKNKLIVCAGGDGQWRSLKDTWVYHCEGRWWERRQWAGAWGSSRAVAFDAKSGKVVRLQPRSKHGHHIGWTVWVYDAAKNQWETISLSAPRGAFWLVYDPVNSCLVSLNSTMKAQVQVLKLDLAALKRTPAQAGPRPEPGAPTGKYVLRDATTAVELRKWKSEQDAWIKGVPANTWVPIPTHGTGRPNWGRSWSSIVYDPSRQQIYYRDGGHGSYHGAVTDHYDIPTGRWFRSDRRYGPPWPMGTYFAWGRSFSYAPWAVHTYKYGLYYNPLRKRLQRSMGQSGRMKGIGSGNIEYDPDTGCWGRKLVPTGIGGTGGAFGGGVNVPGVPDGMISVNNFTRYGVKNGTATLITADGAKSFKSIGTLPRAWEDHCFSWFFDPKRKRVMYYGGRGAGRKKPDLNRKNHKLFALDVDATAPKWVDLKVKPANGSGLPLSSREVVYIPKHDRFLMINGHGKELDIYALDPEANTFRQVKLAAAGGKPPAHGGVAMGLQYDSVTDLCFYIAKKSTHVPSMHAFRYVPAEK
jgi:hypothetical protein